MEQWPYDMDKQKLETLEQNGLGWRFGLAPHRTEKTMHVALYDHDATFHINEKEARLLVSMINEQLKDWENPEPKEADSGAQVSKP